MLRFAPRTFGRAVMTRSATGKGAVANTEATQTSTTPLTQKSDVELLDGNIWFVNTKTPHDRVFGFRWTPGLWARAKQESAETNKAVLERIKTAELTPRDLFNLTGLGFAMWGTFIVGEMIGRWKIFGYRGVEPHHGHGLWTDTPTHH